MTRAPRTQRYCAHCGNRLSSYNAQKFCHPCDLAFREQLAHPPQVPAGFWQTDQMRDALSTWHIGRVIYAYRLHPHHGRVLPQELIASWLGLTQAQLSRIEKGPAPEQLSRLTQWAQALRIPVELLWFKLPLADEDEAIAPDHHDGDAGLRLARWLLAGGRGTPPAASHTGDLGQIALALDDAYRYFDGSVVEFFRDQLARCKADDGQRGPTGALPLMLAILGAITRHSKDMRPDVRRSLLTVGADGAEFAGWLYRDLYDPVTATFLYDRAMEWAQAAGSLPLQGYVLLKKSQMAYESKDAAAVLGLAQAAEQGPWQLPARVRAEVVQQEALGLAMIGESAIAVEQHLGEASELLTRTHPDDDQLFGTYFNEGTLQLRSATCFTEAGKPQRAVEMFGAVLAGNGLSRRDSGFFSARQANALALSGEPDEAASLATTAVKVARETRSERTMNVIIEVLQVLEPWRNRASVRALHEVLAPAR
ncbi:helix-turn-helix domain-containing protein [Nocardia sp. NPDC055165]